MPQKIPCILESRLSVDALSLKSFELIKTIVYKPGTSENITKIPIAIAWEGTETVSKVLGEKLDLKELHLASEDLLLDFFAVDTNSCVYFMTKISIHGMF